MRLNTETMIDEITGLPRPRTTEPSWVVVMGQWAYSQHPSEAAARAWIKWHLRYTEQAIARVVKM